MTKLVLPVFGICLLAALACTPSAQSEPDDQPADETPFAGPPAPEELKVLEPLVGEWTSEVVARPSLGLPDGLTSKGSSHTQWTHNGHFLRQETTSVSANGRFELTVLTGYNPRAKQFRQFTFTSEGNAGEAVGTWDDKTRTINWEGVNLPEGWTGVGRTVIGDDEATFSIVIKNENGEVVRDATATAKRAKPKG
jgi:hypothetical protein